MARAYSASAWGSSAFEPRALLVAAFAQPCEIAARSARVLRGRATAISAFISSVSIRPAARRSSTWSPMAMPMRQACALPVRRKRQKGRFWIGKSQPGWLAEATQLRSVGSCVAFDVVMICRKGEPSRPSVSLHRACARLPSCIHAACLGARLVLDHSSSIAYFTSSSFSIISAVRGVGGQFQAMSVRDRRSRST